ncbi:hypothetical protein OEW28_04010 [Defluviimonas sp. WL0002]|uniref:Uncharacterized protein n=1 Tax=Albidovulum marisflavi TaxID=2984159 RepID=A0ABT2Z9M3_9RHOB|nr:hypothetical protein [Defluviimonas sp. WL0002]MCV2867783.1 hypothetical protein [Defluviimonas sp. WL0002]
MLIGFFLRRIVTFTLCAGAFWLGVKTDQLIQPAPAAAACEEASNGH